MAKELNENTSFKISIQTLIATQARYYAHGV